MKKIITHDGTFHLDEILAVSILQKLYPATQVIRTRDRKILEEDNIFAVVDVMGAYEPTKNFYDHHQRGFFETFNTKHKVKLSSAGLVYKHFGLELLKAYEIPDKYYEEIYEEYFLSVDAIDNGYDIDHTLRINHEGANLEQDALDESVKTVNKTCPILFRGLASCVGLYNDTEDFEGALSFVKKDLDMYLKRFKNMADTKEMIEERIKATEGEVLVVESKDNISYLVCDLEKKYNRDYKYIICNDKIIKVYAAKVEKWSYEMKKPLYEKWRGLRDEELVKVSGIKGAKFVHVTGFLGVCETIEAAEEMCAKSLQNQ